jgi:hypothetical protein
VPISLESKGSFNQTDLFLKKALSGDVYKSLSRFGSMCVAALAAATPTRTGLASQSWTFEVVQNGSGWEMSWHNTDTENGFPVAIMLQYGHGTGTGGYVQGVDYINPAIRPIFDQIEQAVMREVGLG